MVSSRKSRPRRRRRRWDMQTFRLCENQFDMSTTTFLGDCNTPDISMVKILATNTELPTVRRSLLFGGGHLRVRYNAAIVNHTDCPCSHGVHVVTAVVKLPLLEDQSTPAYLPNLVVTRTFESVVRATNADNDEDILFWQDDQLDVSNIACDPPNCVSLHEIAGTGCIGAGNPFDTGIPLIGTFIEGNAAAMYGRVVIDHKIAVKRRLREREALFLYTAMFSNLGSGFNDCPGWPVRLNAYLRYAVR